MNAFENIERKMKILGVFPNDFKNLIYYSAMLGSRLSGCWLPYHPRLRHISTDEKKPEKLKTIFKHMNQKSQTDKENENLTTILAS